MQLVVGQHTHTLTQIHLGDIWSSLSAIVLEMKILGQRELISGKRSKSISERQRERERDTEVHPHR